MSVRAWVVSVSLATVSAALLCAAMRASAAAIVHHAAAGPAVLLILVSFLGIWFTYEVVATALSKPLEDS